MVGAKKKPVVRRRLLAALFAKAKKLGIPAEELRETISFEVIGKRLSDADNQELFKMVEHLAGLYPPSPQPSPAEGRGSMTKEEAKMPARGEGEKKEYPLSREGLLQELEDAARQRWGEEFIDPLNAFVNHNRPVPTHYKFLNITTLKAIKNRLMELNRGGLDKRT